MPRPMLVLFNVNETLSDLEPLRARFEEVGAPGALLETWFARTLRDGFALTAAGAYADFRTVSLAVGKPAHGARSSPSIRGTSTVPSAPACKPAGSTDETPSTPPSSRRPMPPARPSARSQTRWWRTGDLRSAVLRMS